jgi:exodeoxyribonuclease-3
VTIHNLYIPAGGDEPNPESTRNSPQASFLDELQGCMDALARPGSILVGDLNVRPLETDVWSHKQLCRW